MPQACLRARWRGVDSNHRFLGGGPVSAVCPIYEVRSSIKRCRGMASRGFPPPEVASHERKFAPGAVSFVGSLFQRCRHPQDGARPITFYARGGVCWQPDFKRLTFHGHQHLQRQSPRGRMARQVSHLMAPLPDSRERKVDVIETPRQPERRRLPRYRMLESTLPPEASPLRTDSPAGEPNGPVVALTFRATVDQPQRIVPPHCCFTLASGAQPGALGPAGACRPRKFFDLRPQAHG